jgi:hypothetical protein
MPFSRFENWDACILEMKNTGHDKDSAEKICGAIKDRAEKGMLYKSVPTELDILSKGEDELVVGGYASWELCDPERDIITTQAQTKALQRLFTETAPEYRDITANHKEFKLGIPQLKYVNGKGEEFFSHVNEKGTYLISKIRSDKLKTTQTYREKIQKGELGMYSISAVPLQYEIIRAEDGQPARRVDDMEYWAITLCEKGVVKAVNPKAEAKVISKAEEKPRKSELPLTEEEILGKYGFNKASKCTSPE